MTSDRRVLHRPRLHERDDLLGCGVRHRVLPDDRDRRRLASADAWRMQHANVAAEQRRQLRQQLMRTGEVAGNRIADAHGDRRRSGVALLHHVEVVIEGRHLVDLGHRHLHLGRERDEMRGRQTAVPILNLVQVLDQQIPATGSVAEQCADVFARRGSTARPFGVPRTRPRLPLGWLDADWRFGQLMTIESRARQRG